MTRPTFTPEVFTIPHPELTLNEAFATGTHEGKNYRVAAYPAIMDYMELDDTPYEPQSSIASTGPLEGWWNTTQNNDQVSQVRKLISERGLEFALRFTRAFIDAEAVAMVADDGYAWGALECISFGAKNEDMNVMSALDWLEFVGGYWVDLVLEVEEPSYDGEGFEWVTVEVTSTPNSESAETDDNVLHALENFGYEVAGAGEDFELVIKPVEAAVA